MHALLNGSILNSVTLLSTYINIIILSNMWLIKSVKDHLFRFKTLNITVVGPINFILWQTYSLIIITVINKPLNG